MVSLQGITQTRRKLHCQKELIAWAAIRENKEELWNKKSKAGKVWLEEDTSYLCTQWNDSKHLTFLFQPPFPLIKKINNCNSWWILTSHRCWLATGRSHRGSEEDEGRENISLMNNKPRCFFYRRGHIKDRNNMSKADVGRRQGSTNELWRTWKVERRSSNPPCGGLWERGCLPWATGQRRNWAATAEQPQPPPRGGWW